MMIRLGCWLSATLKAAAEGAAWNRVSGAEVIGNSSAPVEDGVGLKAFEHIGASHTAGPASVCLALDFSARSPLKRRGAAVARAGVRSEYFVRQTFGRVGGVGHLFPRREGGVQQQINGLQPHRITPRYSSACRKTIRHIKAVQSSRRMTPRDMNSHAVICS